jgi:hypothetical protein
MLCHAANSVTATQIVNSFLDLGLTPTKSFTVALLMIRMREGIMSSIPRQVKRKMDKKRRRADELARRLYWFNRTLAVGRF